MARSYKDCAKAAGLSDEVDAYLRGEMDPDDPRFRKHLSQKKIEAMNQAYQRKLEAVAIAEMNDFINRYDGDAASAVRAYLTQDDLATGRTSVEDQINGVTRLYMGRLNELVSSADNRTFMQRLTSTGATSDKAFSDNLIREIFGTSTGDVDAAKLAKLWGEVAEDLRIQINKAGGLIRKLDDWGMPQKHVTTKMADAGQDEWARFTAQLLDLDRMGIRTENDAALMLREVYETITTNGANKLDPDNLPRTGKGKLANQHREHRALHFRDGNAWLAYAEAYGDPDAVGAIISHVQEMSRDLGLLRSMGPNPEAVYQTMRKRVIHEGDIAAGKTGKHPGSRTNHIDNIWANITGLGVEHTRWAEWGAGVRAFLSAAKLGGVTLSSLPDVASTAGIVMMQGMSQARWAKSWIKQFTPGLAKQGREQAMRMGIMSQQIIDDFSGNARYTDPEALALARKTSNAVYKLALLTPWDRANRTAFKLSLVSELSDLPSDYAAISSKGAEGRLKRLLDKHGITAEDWAEFQGGKDAAEGNMINPMNLSSRSGAKFLGMIESSANIAVLQPTTRTRAVLNQGAAAGSAKGEMFRHMSQWKSFPVAFMQARMSNMVNTAIGKHGDSVGFRVAYIGHQVATMTLLGVVAVQAKEISKGRDPIKADTPEEWGKLLLQGGIQSGVGGLWYESVYGMLAHGRSPATLLAPPALSMFDDLVTGAILRDIDAAEMDRIDGQIVDLLGTMGVRALGWVPGQSLFYLRAAWDQMVIPSVADQISDKERRRIANRNRRIKRERGQDRWVTPSGIRMPEFTD